MGVPGTVTRPRSRSLLRGLSGVLVGGLVALALVLLAGWFYADRSGLPGPAVVTSLVCWGNCATAVGTQLVAHRSDLHVVGALLSSASNAVT